MENDDFWRSEIVQITARTTESGAIDLELTPRSGNYTILFGRLDDAEQKLDKLLRFYQEGLGKAGWDRYRTINVKYAGQVVCTGGKVFEMQEPDLPAEYVPGREEAGKRFNEK